MSAARQAALRRTVQAWIALGAEDPAAVSALAVARARLAAAQQLSSLRRLRVVELSGPLPADAEIEDRLHASTWFYNPHKETCTLRTAPEQGVPIREGEECILVTPLRGARRAPAERWWQRDTGRRIAVREGVVWVLGFEPGADAVAAADALAVLRDRRNGLFCNPHAEWCSRAGARVPLPWIENAMAHHGGA